MTAGKRGRVLLIGLDYHDYARAIAREIELLGYEVCFHSIQPSTPRLKVLRRLSQSGYQAALDRYHAGLAREADRDGFDFVIFIQAHQYSHENMRHLKALQPRARFVLYNWDAITTHDYTPYLDYFDEVFTFDPVDAKTHGLTHLPLFCLRRFQDLKDRSETPRSVYFVGNIVNPARYQAVQRFREYCGKNDIQFSYFLSTTVHGYTQMLRGGLVPTDVTLRQIAPERFVDMVEQSAAVFDFSNHRQSGYTMRTIENLCARKKLITNNPLIRDEHFHSADRIYVFDGLDFEGVARFLDTPLAAPDKTFPQFHVQNFVKNLMKL